jgi:hypothetical protein
MTCKSLSLPKKPPKKTQKYTELEVDIYTYVL